MCSLTNIFSKNLYVKLHQPFGSNLKRDQSKKFKTNKNISLPLVCLDTPSCVFFLIFGVTIVSNNLADQSTGFAPTVTRLKQGETF